MRLRAVNFVWNYCNGAQVHALDHNTKWPGKADLEALTKGASKDLGIPAQTVQEVCDEYIDRRRGSMKAKLRWRGKRSLGWVRRETFSVWDVRRLLKEAPLARSASTHSH